MMFLEYLFIFLLGLAIGSFLNCVIYRLAASERGAASSEASLAHSGREPRPDGSEREKWNSFLKGRSYCPKCKRKLSWQDLVPVFSFIFLRGKCRYCKKPISLQYPIVELATGIIFLSIFFVFSSNIYAIAYLLLLSCFLILIFVYDLKHYIIPDGAVFSAIGISFVYRLWEFRIWDLFRNWDLGFRNLESMWIVLLSAVGASTFFLLIFLVSQGRWMGFGDVKLAFFMGLFLGFPNILAALFLAFLIGAIIGVCLIIFGKKKFSSEVPFGPFLIMGTFLALLFGEKLISWYLGFVTI